MSPETKTRLLAGLAATVVVPMGLIARSYRSGASVETLLGFLATYLGDTLWPFMFYFIGRFIFPKASSRWIFIAVLTLTLTLEFGQLWKPPLLQWLRQQPISGFILGNSFIWSDVVCLIAGAVIAVIVDILFVAQRSNRL